MTQTRLYYTPTVLTVATGVLFSGLNPAFDLIHDLTGGVVLPANVPGLQEQVRAEIVRQHPWVAELRLPADPADRRDFLARVIAEHGAALELQLPVDTRLVSA